MKASAKLASMGGLGVLHLVATVPFPLSFDRWFSGGAASAARVSPDLVLLLALAVLSGAIERSRLFAHLAAFVLLLTTVYRAAVALFPVMRQRPFELLDVRELSGLFHLWLHDDPPSLQVLQIAGLVVGLLGLQFAFAWSFRRVARMAERPDGAIAWAILLQAVVIAGVACCSVGKRGSTIWQPSSLGALVKESYRTVGILLDAASIEAETRARIRDAAERFAATPGGLTKLDRADVHVLFIESYGRVAMRQPELAAHLQSLWRELAPQVQAAGFGVCSSACQPSVIGGESLLAHMQLLTGVAIARRDTLDLLLNSELVPLPKHFAAVGYDTIEVLPAMPRHWPEGQRFYGFAEVVTQLELGYEGTVYPFGHMPDQFALHQLLARIARPTSKPLFTMFVSVSSHAPFSAIPPYIADWQIDADTFKCPPKVEYLLSWLHVPHDPLLVPAYRDALDYSLRTAIGFVCRLPRPSLVFVLGDHQPPMSGAVVPPDTSPDVPIHVLANRPELLEPCRTLGFVDGFAVPADMPAFSTSGFAGMLLRLYSQ